MFYGGLAARADVRDLQISSSLGVHDLFITPTDPATIIASAEYATRLNDLTTDWTQEARDMMTAQVASTPASVVTVDSKGQFALASQGLAAFLDDVCIPLADPVAPLQLDIEFYNRLNGGDPTQLGIDAHAFNCLWTSSDSPDPSTNTRLFTTNSPSMEQLSRFVGVTLFPLPTDPALSQRVQGRVGRGYAYVVYHPDAEGLYANGLQYGQGIRPPLNFPAPNFAITGPSQVFIMRAPANLAYFHIWNEGATASVGGHIKTSEVWWGTTPTLAAQDILSQAFLQGAASRPVWAEYASIDASSYLSGVTSGGAQWYLRVYFFYNPTTPNRASPYIGPDSSASYDCDTNHNADYAALLAALNIVYDWATDISPPAGSGAFPLYVVGRPPGMTETYFSIPDGWTFDLATRVIAVNNTTLDFKIPFTAIQQLLSVYASTPGSDTVNYTRAAAKLAEYPDGYVLGTWYPTPQSATDISIQGSYLYNTLTDAGVHFYDQKIDANTTLKTLKNKVAASLPTNAAVLPYNVGPIVGSDVSYAAMFNPLDYSVIVGFSGGVWSGLLSGPAGTVTSTNPGEIETWIIAGVIPTYAGTTAGDLTAAATVDASQYLALELAKKHDPYTLDPYALFRNGPPNLSRVYDADAAIRANWMIAAIGSTDLEGIVRTSMAYTLSTAI
jgi:hypothetical protein